MNPPSRLQHVRVELVNRGDAPGVLRVVCRGCGLQTPVPLDRDGGVAVDQLSSLLVETVQQHDQHAAAEPRRRAS